MYSKFNLITIAVTLLMFFNFTACSDDNSTGSNGGETSGSQAAISGTVEDEFEKSSTSKAKDIEGTVVTAATISSNGTIQLMEDTETEVQSSGEFTLEVDVSTVEEVVIVAENEGEQLKGFISAEIENGSSYTIKPIDVESSAETEVFAQVKSEGNVDIVHKSDIETLVTSNSAADVYGDGSATADVAAAVSNSAETRAEFFSEFSESAESDIDAYFEAMTDAQFSYESTLNASSSVEEEEAALEAYLETKVNAYSEASQYVLLPLQAEFLHAQGMVILNSMSSVSSDVENEARNSSSYMIAIATDNAVQARAESSGMSEGTVSAIADAGLTLRSEVRGSVGSEGTISAAFETYHDEVQAALESDSSVEGTAVVTIDTEINAAGGIKTTFNSALSGLVDTSSLTDLYIDFNNEVDAVVDANSALIGDINAEVLSDIMVLINLSS